MESSAKIPVSFLIYVFEATVIYLKCMQSYLDEFLKSSWAEENRKDQNWNIRMNCQRILISYYRILGNLNKHQITSQTLRRHVTSLSIQSESGMNIQISSWCCLPVFCHALQESLCESVFHCWRTIRLHDSLKTIVFRQSSGISSKKPDYWNIFVFLRLKRLNLCPKDTIRAEPETTRSYHSRQNDFKTWRENERYRQAGSATANKMMHAFYASTSPRLKKSSLITTCKTWEAWSIMLMAVLLS